jgi:hypothetical protein
VRVKCGDCDVVVYVHDDAERDWWAEHHQAFAHRGERLIVMGIWPDSPTRPGGAWSAEQRASA